MEAQEIKLLVKKQKVFFETGLSKNVNFRKEKLNSLYSVIVRNEELILDALKADLNKSKYEAYMTEVGIVLSEIKFMLKKITKWSKPKRVRTSITQAPGKSVIYHEPFGTTLIISPWNYPFQLAINPLIGAIAAGNTVILKPSNYSINTSKII
ncbi:MAG: aldehyde dehydrogenase family protein, partial [Bacilli bacterium]